jgi:DNA-binding MarR family transcriptional regulator
MTSQATTAVIHRLEAAGHVERLRSRSDGRSARLQVSDAAVALGWQFFGPLLDRLIATTEALDPGEQTVVKDYLVAVSEALG